MKCGMRQTGKQSSINCQKTVLSKEVITEDSRREGAAILESREGGQPGSQEVTLWG
jgi:hypothetical protein